MTPAREDGPAILPDSGELTLPDPPEDHAPQDNSSGAPSGGARSIIDDVADLVLDARTYLDAELSYQKTRASFVGDRVKRTIGYVLIAAILGLVALIGLVMGLIIALTPLITAWGATAVVIGIMTVIIFILLRGAGSAWGEMMDAVNEGRSEENGDS
ncbi:hypothetical protein GCM10009127_19380 [Alteraurantiacibacter aestuarii]|uniref:phage holin family protein n=1 Tax=Alteraurantiacibacter aestuarii TaxID=650004 RepID=UPI0031D10329